MSKYTPWGLAQEQEKKADGIVSYSTASHGGYCLSAKRQAEMPEYLRLGNEGETGWYEEDCDWCRVAVAFPQFFSQKEQSDALDTLRHWIPEAYERHVGEILLPGQSRKKDEHAFLQAHLNDYLVLAAFGQTSYLPKIPEGMVGVLAGRGGRGPRGAYPLDTRYFLVPQKEYETRPPYGFVVNPERHPEWVAMNKQEEKVSFEHKREPERGNRKLRPARP